MNLETGLLDILARAQSIAVLTGAGVSAESGIPTFRDAQSGLWAKFDPRELATPEAFLRNPKLIWDWYSHRRAMLVNCLPNPGHIALAEWQSRIPTFTLITQNVDGLHQLAGSRDVIELHGNIRRAKCYDYGHSAEIPSTPSDEHPTCPDCGSLLRPDVVWFGESLSQATLSAATDAAIECDVFLSIGTSSQVYPAAALPGAAMQQGAVFIEINPNRTPLSEYADFVISADSGFALHEIVRGIPPC